MMNCILVINNAGQCYLIRLDKDGIALGGVALGNDPRTWIGHLLACADDPDVCTEKIPGKDLQWIAEDSLRIGEVTESGEEVYRIIAEVDDLGLHIYQRQYYQYLCANYRDSLMRHWK